ncbi:chitinase-like protein 1 [Quercus lobata]|uniref:Glycoside hydrolase family 19 catalytic domain-containing protein n=1 Tax=Quercus lobata TaxID=97700 RepID=A0A7N2L6A2_QUELO|nr:chitinase-like protein 1 [Quercus lobata]
MLHAKMECKRFVLLIILAFVLVPVNCDESSLNGPYNRGIEECYHCKTNPRGLQASSDRPVCIKCRCCAGAVSDHFQSDQFEKMFSNRNSLEVEDHENKGFLDYESFITASAHYQPYGFGTTYIHGNFFGTKEVAAFLAHVATKTSCENKVGTMKQLARDSCYNKEMNSNSDYCDEHYKNIYPCIPGVAYYGRGALPFYWNYNYGEASKDLKVDLLSHPEYIEQNATLAFQVALWRWMTPIKKHQPSAHNVFTGYWKPTKNDTLAKRVSGFGTTMNVLYGDLVCGQGDNESMNNIISHYLYYLDLMGVGQEKAEPREVLSCAKQVAFNPSSSSP